MTAKASAAFADVPRQDRAAAAEFVARLQAWDHLLGDSRLLSRGDRSQISAVGFPRPTGEAIGAVRRNVWGIHHPRSRL